MFRIRWIAEGRVALRPTGEFRRLDTAIDGAARHLPQLSSAFGISHGEIVDEHGTVRATTRLDSAAPPAAPQRYATFA